MAQSAAASSVTSSMLVREHCPSCTSPSSTPLMRLAYDAPPLNDYLRSYYGGRADLSRLAGCFFELEFCSACGLIYQRTVPIGGLLQSLYDEWIPSTAREQLWQSYTIDSYRYWAAEIDFIVQHFGGRPAQISVFDFGLGWSEWATMARAYGCIVAGTELSQERLHYARASGIETVEWRDVPHRKFHFINTEQVFEHLVEPRETLAHLAHALHPNGLLKISVPDGRAIKKKLRSGVNAATLLNCREDLMPIAPLEHINCFDHAALTALGRQIGLKEFRPRFRQLYDGYSGWLSPKRAVRNLLRPVYRYIYPKRSFIYFTR